MLRNSKSVTAARTCIIKADHPTQFVRFQLQDLWQDYLELLHQEPMVNQVKEDCHYEKIEEQMNSAC